MSDSAFYRSGAVARLLDMPVATLRVWERRYGICQPRLSPSGQRLYSAADVERLALIQRLVAAGHAIGTLAGLDLPALQAVADAQAGALARPAAGAVPARLPVHVSDALLRTRWQTPRWRRLWPAHTVFVVDAASAAVRIDRVPQLLPDDRPRPPPAGQRWGLVLGHAATPAVAALEAAGACVLRAPDDEGAVAAWLARLLAEPAGTGGSAEAPAGQTIGAAADLPEPPAPRWDETTLQALADLPSTVACECPRHLAELLIQLAGFEAYSARCAHRGDPDAALHRRLQRVSGQARLLLEDALAQVAEAEGLLPAAGGAPLSR